MTAALSRIDGTETISGVVDAAGEVAVVVVAGQRDIPVIESAVPAGSRTFVVKGASVAAIVDAIRSLEHSTATEIDPEVSEKSFDPADDDSVGLTQRELEVLGLLAQRCQPKQIAHELGITVNTCRGYVKNILAKLDAHSALEAVLEANRRGIITLPGGG